MNVFNRVVVVLLLILLILLSATFIILPEQAFTAWRNIATNLDNYTTEFTGRIIMIVVLLAVILLALFLLWLEFRRKRVKDVRVEKMAGGEARVAVESVVQRVQYAVGQVSKVLSVKPAVTTKGKRVDLHLDVETGQDVNVPAKTEEISQVARNVVEEQMGLALGKVIVTLRHAPGTPPPYEPPAQRPEPRWVSEPKPEPKPEQPEPPAEETEGTQEQPS